MSDPDHECPIHRKPHPLKKCRAFHTKPIEERKAYLKDNHICYKCCGSTQHVAKDCKVPIKCSECNSERHIAALHPGPPTPKDNAVTEKEEGGELDEVIPTITTKCTEICGNAHIPHSCARICPIKFSPIHTEDLCGGIPDLWQVRKQLHTRVFRWESATILPTLIECDLVPDDRAEIPSPDVARHHPHLRPVTNKIPAVDPDAPIHMLLGRDILQVHKVREQINGPYNAPYAQRLDLGWVIMGEACFGAVHKPVEVNVYKANILQNGRTSFLRSCPNNIHVKEGCSSTPQKHHAFFTHQEEAELVRKTDSLGHAVFKSSKDDNKTALSIDDRAFLTIMEREVYQDTDHSWVAPLPFRSPRQSLPSNRELAVKRLGSLKKSLEKKQETKKHYTEFMQKMLDNDQAEHAPPLEPGKEHWYLPTFGVYYPMNPGKIRVVFDSSAECDGICLNYALNSGPDLNNTLLGVLLRFRKEPVAVTSDVQQMFYCFVVRKDRRDYLRFLWYEDNDFAKNIVEYRMK
ncbi:hypothetical protein NFI96_016157, partial [Prochilodus magdalenae]